MPAGGLAYLAKYIDEWEFPEKSVVSAPVLFQNQNRDAGQEGRESRHPDGLAAVLPCAGTERRFFHVYNKEQVQAAKAESAGKMTRSLSSWLFTLNPYFLPSSAPAVSG